MIRSLTITSDNNNSGAKYKKTALPFRYEQSVCYAVLPIASSRTRCSVLLLLAGRSSPSYPIIRRSRDMKNKG